MSTCGYCGGDSSGEGDFLPCCGKPICQGCFLSSHSVPGAACRLCSAVVPHNAEELLEAYERLAVAGDERAARRGLMLSSIQLAKARRDGDDEAVRSLQEVQTKYFLRGTSILRPGESAPRGLDPTDLCDYFGKVDLDLIEGRSYDEAYDVESLVKFRDARVRLRGYRVLSTSTGDDGSSSSSTAGVVGATLSSSIGSKGSDCRRS